MIDFNSIQRQAFAYILARQVNSLLSRTKLNVTIHCQAWHAKNARHMLLDVIDHYEPSMLIVGSRGVSHLKGILLGSTSHYLIQVRAFSNLLPIHPSSTYFLFNRNLQSLSWWHVAASSVHPSAPPT